jgi:hypothetical protein
MFDRDGFFAQRLLENGGMSRSAKLTPADVLVRRASADDLPGLAQRFSCTERTLQLCQRRATCQCVSDDPEAVPR